MKQNSCIYIFLDVDGVLNTASQWDDMYSFSDSCLENFFRFVESLNHPVKVVLSTAWRRGYDDVNGNHAPQIHELLSRLKRGGVEVIGKTGESQGFDRAEEINSFITEHHLQDFPCIVIDDDEELFQSPLLKNCRFIHTNDEVGFVFSPQKKRWQRFVDSLKLFR